MAKEETIRVAHHIAIAEKYTGDCTNAKKIQKLGEEVVELAMGIAEWDMDNMREELGDCLFILIHLKNRICPKITVDELLTLASNKMVKRNNPYSESFTKSIEAIDNFFDAHEKRKGGGISE